MEVAEKERDRKYIAGKQLTGIVRFVADIFRADGLAGSLILSRSRSLTLFVRPSKR
jgi:hypothetical protein